MSWRSDLGDWLTRGPRPHEPPGGAASVYGWLRQQGPQILAETARPRRLNHCSGGRNCDYAAIHRVRFTKKYPDGEVTKWLKRCGRHTPTGAETAPL